MPLLDLKTDLKSLKYGSDQPGGGNSGQPYVTTDINTVDTGFNRFRMTKFDDGLIRGGVVGATNASVVDTIRVGKFLKDFPKGPLFIIKQVGLQLSNPRLEVKKLKTDNPTKGGGLLKNVGSFILNTANKIQNAVGPTRIYNLGINTLAQVPVNAFGGHLNRHGFLPVQDDQTKYLAVAQNNNNEENNRLTGLRNRFGLGVSYDLNKGNIKLRKKELKSLNAISNIFYGGDIFANSVYNDIQNTRIDDYIGGPQSVYGIGRTLILRTPEYTNDNIKIRDAKSKNYNAIHIPEVKIKNSFDFGLSLLTSNQTNLTDKAFDLSKDSQTVLTGSLLNYDVKSYNAYQLVKDKQKTQEANASSEMRVSSAFVGASTKTFSSFNPEKFSNLTEDTYKKSTLNDNIASKEDIKDTEYPTKIQGASASDKMRTSLGFVGVSTKTSSSFVSNKFPDLTDFGAIGEYKRTTLNDYIASINDITDNLLNNPWVNQISSSADLGVSKQYFSGSQINIYNSDLATYSGASTTDASITINNSTNKIVDIEIVNKGNVPLRNASYQKYQQIIESRKLRETTYILDNNQVNAFGLYGNGFPIKETLGDILPDSTQLPVYSNKDKIVKINIPWNKVTRELRIGSGKQDVINLTPIFSAPAGTIGDTPPLTIPYTNVQTINDLVKFRIQALNGNNPTQANWMIFRAYLTQLTDNTDPTWNPVRYVGRGEEFYIYTGFTRKIQIGFKVAALSAEEMEPMYQKLNFLMGNVMPDYTSDGLMRGPMVKMTVGNWIDGQDGILTSVGYTISNDSPWEVSLNTINGNEPLILPHIVEVSLGFTPIGSQTKGINKVSAKSTTTSHIAQNYNDYQYIK